MKTDRKYLSWAKEIRDEAQGEKKVDQPTTTWAKVAMTSKKRKCHVIPSDPSGS